MASPGLNAAKWLKGTLAALAIGLAATPWADEVYRIVDEEGNVTYTDQPRQDQKAEKLELREANRLPATRVPRREAPQQNDDEVADYRLRITYPPNEFHVTPGIRDLNVNVAVQPALESGHRLRITDNGDPVAGTTLENIVIRGPHVIQAHVVDEEGRVVSQSEPVIIYVHRPTVRN